MKKYRKAEENGEVKNLFNDLYEKRHNSGAKCLLTVEIGRALHRINVENNGALSYAQLRDKLCEEGFGDYSESSVRRWYVALGVRVVRLYLRPKLKNTHKLDRIDWTLNEIDMESMTFGYNYDCVHIDEAWYFMLANGRAVKVMPNADGTYTIPEAPAVVSKRHIDKVMFLAALARPHPVYPSRKFGDQPANGKILMHPIIEMGEYTRGPLAGTEKVVNVSVNAEVYVNLIKRQVVPSIMTEMWWHHRDSGTPDAGRIIYVQQDGAPPHTAEKTLRALAYYRSDGFYNRTGFRLHFVTQPARSPDLNICDLAFWHSNKCKLKGKNWATRQQLVEGVVHSFAEYPHAELEKGWRFLYRVYRGILEDLGGNKYKKTSGDRKLQRQNLPPRVDCPPDLVAAARAEAARLRQALGLLAREDSDSSAGESSSGESDENAER